MGIAIITKIVGYYILWFDNLLDTIALSLATLAGGGTVTTIKGNISVARLTSTEITKGNANTVSTMIKVRTAIIMLVFSIFYSDYYSCISFI